MTPPPTTTTRACRGMDRSAIAPPTPVRATRQHGIGAPDQYAMFATRLSGRIADRGDAQRRDFHVDGFRRAADGDGSDTGAFDEHGYAATPTDIARVPVVG